MLKKNNYTHSSSRYEFYWFVPSTDHDVLQRSPFVTRKLSTAVKRTKNQMILILAELGHGRHIEATSSEQRAQAECYRGEVATCQGR